MALPALVLLFLPAAASAGSGGGGGGVCYQDPVAPEPGELLVLDSCFTPDAVTVSTGDVVRWRSQAQVPHNIVFDEGPSSGTLEPYTLASFAVRLNQPGTYIYSCTFHPGMDGRVTVQGDPLSGDAFNVVSSQKRTPTEVLDDVFPVGTAPTDTVLHIRIDPATGVVLLLVALAFGLGAGAGTRLVRR